MDSTITTRTKTLKTAQPHDKLIKKFLSNSAIMRDILEIHLPADIIKRLDLKRIELQRDSFIDDEHRVFAVDLLFKIGLQEEKNPIWLLTEHQVKMDEWMPFRLLKYKCIIWDHVRKNSALTVKLPFIYSIIIYNGQRPYSKSLALKELIYPEWSHSLFSFNESLTLIDLTQIEDETLQKHARNHIRGTALLLTLKHILNKKLSTKLDELFKVYKHLDEAGYREELADLLYYLLNEGRNLDTHHLKSVIYQHFSQEVEGKLMTIAQALRLEGWNEGIQQGMQQGVQQGVQQGEQKTIRLLAKRLLSENTDIHFIAKVTGLSLSEIQELQRQ